MWDVAVDVNPRSHTFRQWVGVELTDDEPSAVLHPARLCTRFLRAFGSRGLRIQMYGVLSSGRRDRTALERPGVEYSLAGGKSDRVGAGCGKQITAQRARCRMMLQRVLVIGASGQVGREVVLSAPVEL